ncbi:MAG: pitrilysin family protein [Myxococcota bacterium]
MTVRTELSDGALLFVEENRSIPLVDIEIALRSGAEIDPPMLAGRSRMLWRLVRMGTDDLAGADFEEELALLGARLAFETTASSVRVHGVVLSRNLDRFIELLSAVLHGPALREADLLQIKRETEAELVALRDSDRSLVGRAFRRAFFRDHTYARSMSGTHESLLRIGMDDLAEARQQHLRRSHLVFGFAGDIDPAGAERCAQRVLDGIARAEPVEVERRDPAPLPGRRIVLVDKPERSQTQLLVGTSGSKVGDPLHDAVSVANVAFGGTFSSPLVQEIREKRGWSYGVHSRLGADRSRDSWTMWAHPAATDLADCLQVQLGLMERFVEDGIDAEEHAFAKEYLTNSHCFELDTPGKRLEAAIDLELFGLPPDHIARYLERVARVDVSASHAAVRERLSTSDLTIALVATADELRPALEQIDGIEAIDVVPHDAVCHDASSS